MDGLKKMRQSFKKQRKTELIREVRCRQSRFVGHILRRNKPTNLRITGKTDGEKARGRQR